MNQVGIKASLNLAFRHKTLGQNFVIGKYHCRPLATQIFKVSLISSGLLTTQIGPWPFTIRKFHLRKKTSAANWKNARIQEG
jgi:hypothetical protein